MYISVPLSSLTPLFNPSSVAIIGASDDPDRLSGRPLRYLIEAQFAGAIYPVNPKRDTVQGLPAFSSIRELPSTPDLALIVVPAASARKAVEDCAARGIKSIYLLTSGFVECGEEGERAQNEIGVIARANGIRILGPNCLGAFNANSRFFGVFGTSMERGLPQGGSVAIASQSGAYGQHLAYLAHRRGLGLSYFMSTGNELDVELGECIEWLAAQPEVRVILAYAEGVRNGARLARALEAARVARRPVVFYKAGASEAGGKAAASHTAALAGADAVYDGMFRQFGVYRARSIEEQLDIAYACSRGKPLEGRRLSIVSVSGGGGVQMADYADACGLEVPPFSQAIQAKLQAIIPMGGTTNPVDVTGQVVNEPDLLAGCLRVVTDESDCSALSVFLGTVPLTRAGDAPLRRAILESTGSFARERTVVVSMVADEASVRAYEAAGCLIFEDPARAIRALGALYGFDAAFGMRRTQQVLLPPRVERAGEALSETEAKDFLRKAGITTLAESLTTSARDAVDAAASIGGPVAMKVVSPDIAHKTEIGGVLLDVSGEQAVRTAFAELSERVRLRAAGARFDGVLVTPMAPRGVEVILGAVNDPAFGSVVMFGLGGVMAECYRDTAFRLAPIDEAEARRMIDETRVAKLLRGWRGAPAADVDALVQALCDLSKLAAGLGEQLGAIDVNPLLVLPEGQGVVALDAVVVTRARLAPHVLEAADVVEPGATPGRRAP